jgi:hypothetical protein
VVKLAMLRGSYRVRPFPVAIHSAHLVMLNHRNVIGGRRFLFEIHEADTVSARRRRQSRSKRRSRSNPPTKPCH